MPMTTRIATQYARPAVGMGLAGAAIYGYSQVFHADMLASSLELAPAVLFGAAYFVKDKPWGMPLMIGAVGLGAIGVVTHQALNSLTPQVPAPATKDTTQEESAKATTTRGIPYDKLIYLAPIAVAPIAHNLVTIAGAQSNFAKAKPFLLGAVAITFGAVAQRVYLMDDAGIDSGRAVWGQKH
ncbi:Hypothetical Protein FCC1311_060802 [Hondaea fermentalgiana]|uniref:Uncharacterized protein n=1 Tax=Hondaea fermentalgiana TaxID=2315210 RepID=A0A2R5GG57_9STRA|nr:Hypothetical Protein FCC1311_060802 [Hondaea fermentalgiana]|eukprot:GBG29860.1 Hypothetical Protein FCC1311_060802 [Hondaea fermentalgiana]